jgi:hypothetical protein
MTPPERSERRAWFAAALIITLAYHPLVLTLARLGWQSFPNHWRVAYLQYDEGANLYRGAELIFGLALALATPRASGLGFGHPLRHWKLLSWSQSCR